MSDWQKAVRCRMSKTKAGRAWMAWAIWGMIGTAFTMEGTTHAGGIGGLGMAWSADGALLAGLRAVAFLPAVAACSRPWSMDGAG